MVVLRFISQTDAQDYMQTVHEENLQLMDMRLQQHNAFHTIEQCGNDDK